MDELERADRLARALDDIIFGNAGEPAPELADHEMTHLLDVARKRSEASSEGRQAAMQYESAAWGKLVERLEGVDRSRCDEVIPSEVVDETSQLAEVIMMRRKMSGDVMALAEQHREEVWQKVQARLEGARTKRSRVPFLGSCDRSRPVEPAATSKYTSGNPEFDSLVRAALARAPSRPRDPEMTGRLWARVGGLGNPAELAATLSDGADDGRSPAFAIRALAIAAAVALFIAAAGPVPTSGFAHHPLVEAITDVVGNTGVIESSTVPTVSGGVVPVEGTEVTANEAADLTGLPIAEPSYLPAGFELESSRYYPAGITAPEGGLFALMYLTSDGEGSLAIYQESDAGPSLVASGGSTIDAIVSRQLATYFEGGWRAEDGTLLWETADSQTIVFESQGVRSIVHYSGPRLNPQELLAVADSMVPR